MAKIPKNLSDKEMFQGYEEESTLEDAFRKAEEADAASRRPARGQPQAMPSVAYLTPDLVEQLSGELMALKLQLAQEGITKFRMKVKRDGRNIVITPVET